MTMRPSSVVNFSISVCQLFSFFLMLTQLSTVKSRLALTVTDYDGILTSAIKAVSDRFDKECNRNLARTTGATHERSEEHTSELQSLAYLVCRLLLEKKKSRALR